MLATRGISLKEVSLMIGGPQGSGIETSMSVLSRALAGEGFWVIAEREYYSNIVGRHSYILMRASSEKKVRSLDLPVQILAAVDAETIFTHFGDIEGGVLVYNKLDENKSLADVSSMEYLVKERISKKLKELGVEPIVSSLVNYLHREKMVKPVPIDFAQVISQISKIYKLDPRQLSRYVSSIVISSIATFIDIKEVSLSFAFSSHFKEKPKLVEQNLLLYKYVSEALKEERGLLKLETPEANTFKKALVITGNEAVAIGKIIAGVRYQSYYPITPAADESTFLEKFGSKEVQGLALGPIIVMQTEDEISAISSAIGASLTGARSSTATSGPGFDLMVESLSWAGMNDVPVVITYYQRGSPSTGLPTRGGQGDLMAAIFSGHGEFPRIVISSGDHEEAMLDSAEAFNLAERYQVPVIHLLDKFLANSTMTVEIPDISRFKIDRGKLYREKDDYRRFDLSSPISPRAFVGQKGVVMWHSGDEHDEYGHISEDPENRIKMYAKRMEKLKLIEEEAPKEMKLALIGSRYPDFLVVGWGSVKGTAIEALKLIEKKAGLKGAYINMKMLWPFPKKELEEIIKDVPDDKIVVAEHSYVAWISFLMEKEAGLKCGSKILKYNGRPMMLSEFVNALELILKKEKSEVILNYGA